MWLLLELLPASPYFSGVMIQPTLSVCTNILETTVYLFQIPTFLVSQSRGFASATPQPASTAT